MSHLRIAVIGTGYLGRFHAQKYQKISHVQLIGVCDVNQETCNKVAEELGTQAFNDYHELFGLVDAVSIVVSTKNHFKVAKAFLSQGIHVLLEKPMTETVAEADELIQLAKQQGAKFQIGHLERFNGAKIGVTPYLNQPVFITAERLAPYTPRGADVSVVLDLMIHDLDLIASMVDSPIEKIEANGAAVLSNSIDIAHARLTFENGCVANITASRVSFKSERTMRIFQKDSYLTIDYQKKKFARLTKGDEELFPGVSNVSSQEFAFENSDALLEEIHAFVNAIIDNQEPIVDGKAGRQALATALEISEIIEKNLNRYEKAL